MRRNRHLGAGQIVSQFVACVCRRRLAAKCQRRRGTRALVCHQGDGGLKRETEISTRECNVFRGRRLMRHII